jgi:taurine dioxygenase
MNAVQEQAVNYTTIAVTPLNPLLGAEISGVDLRQPLSAEQLREINRALIEHLVIFFRDQPLDFDSHKTFVRNFGEPHLHGGDPALDVVRRFRVPGHEEIVTIHTDSESKYVAGEDWHSDMTCDPEPPMGSILYLHTVPPVGGDTVFASMYAAYEGLSERMKKYLDGMTATHDGERVFAKIVNDPTKRFPQSVHPVVRTHPVSGRKALFVNKQFTARINDIPKHESEGLLSFLYAHCARPEFQMRFHWRPHSVAFWDNRATQHSAIWDYFPQVRSGYRITVKGDKPA